MKYAKYLATQSIPEWQNHYFKYKKLKKELKVLIKAQESNNTTKFVEAQQHYVDLLYEELETVNQFFVTKEHELVEQYQQLKKLLADAQRAPSRRSQFLSFSRNRIKKSRSTSAIFQDSSPETSPPQSRKAHIPLTTVITQEPSSTPPMTPSPLPATITIITTPTITPSISPNITPTSSTISLPDLELSLNSDISLTSRAPIQDSEMPTPFMPHRDSNAPKRVVMEKRFRFSIKRALEEIHRGLSMLKDFSSLNSVGFRKIIKKHDKVPKFSSLYYFWEHEVSKSYFHTSEVPGNLLKELETIYGNMFTKGNIRQASDKLRVPPVEDLHDWVSCRSGMFVGACFILLVYLIGKSHDYPSNPPFHELIMYSFRVLGVPIIWLWCFATVMTIWTRRKINYVFIFGWNPRKHIMAHNLFEVSALLSFIWLVAVAGYFSHLSGNEPFSKISGPVFPFALFGAYLICIFFPLDAFYRFSRWWMFKSFWRIVRAPFLPVKFKDFFYTDQFTSLSQTLSDLGDMLYLFTTAMWSGESAESIQTWTFRSEIYRPLLQAYPYFLRFLQCLRRYRDSKDRRQLVNAGKYTFSILTVAFSGIKRVFPDSLVILVVYCIIAGTSAFYSWCWDVLMDWDLGHMSCKTKLRPKLMYEKPWKYYLVVVGDLALRCVWAVSLGTTSSPVYFNSLTMSTIASVTEVLRRFFWNIFRLESEHLKNCHHSNATAMPALLDQYRHMKTGFSKENRLSSRYVKDYEDEDVDEDSVIDSIQGLSDLTGGIRHRKNGIY